MKTQGACADYCERCGESFTEDCQQADSGDCEACEDRKRLEEERHAERWAAMSDRERAEAVRRAWQ